MKEEPSPFATFAFIIVLLFSLLIRGSVAIMRD